MATKTVFYSNAAPHDEINGKSGAKDFLLKQFTLGVLAPDDRRVDKAFDNKSDRTFSSAITKVCVKEKEAFVAACAEVMKQAQFGWKLMKEAFEKITTGAPGDAKQKAEKLSKEGIPRISSQADGGLRKAFQQFETGVEKGCLKVWQDYAKKNKEAASVRFTPVVLGWMPAFTTPDPAEQLKVKDLGSENDEKELLEKWKSLWNTSKYANVTTVVTDRLSEIEKSRTKSEQLKSNMTAAYKSNLGEPELFQRFEKDLKQAWRDTKEGIELLRAEEKSAAAFTQELAAVLKNYGSKQGAQPQNLKDLAKHSVEAVTLLKKVSGMTAAARLSYENFFNVLDPLVDQEPGMLGAFEKVARLAQIPVKDLQDLHDKLFIRFGS